MSPPAGIQQIASIAFAFFWVIHCCDCRRIRIIIKNVSHTCRHHVVSHSSKCLMVAFELDGNNEAVADLNETSDWYIIIVELQMVKSGGANLPTTNSFWRMTTKPSMFPPLSKVCRKSIFHPNYEEEGCYQTTIPLLLLLPKDSSIRRPLPLRALESNACKNDLVATNC